MQNDVNNETGQSATGENPVVDTEKQERPAAAQAPVAKEPATEERQTSSGGGGEVDFGAILEQFEQEQAVFHAGDLVEGKVVGVSDRGVLVDFGYKSEGVIPAEDFVTEADRPAVGDAVAVVIKSIHSGDAPPQLSGSDAKSRKIWNDIEEAYKSDTPITGTIVDKTKGGLKVDINGIEAFLPGSQIDSRPIRGLDTYIGQDIEARIIKFSRRRSNIVLSRKVITDVQINEQKAATLGLIEVGYIVEGTIKNLTEYGAFVDIGGIDGLLHVTDMSWGRLQNPGDQFKVGDHLQVKVLKLDREKEKISLGYKQLQPDPWSTVAEMYPVNSRVKGKVSSVTEYGIFVELEPGVEGLVHVSEISWSKRGANPKKMFHKGDEVDVQVLGVDTVEKRISLGMKQLQDNPWDTVALRYPVGSKVHGRVRNLTDFGAFVEIEDGIDGLVHVSDITWAKKLKHPKELLKKDQEVDAIVTHIDPRGQRLSLSMKDLTPSVWETFVATHKPGDVVRGRVSRFTSFGVFVELGEGLEGLCHISELADERVEKPEDVVKLGQELDFKILRIEHEEQKIGLSYRAVGKTEEPVADTRIYTTEAKGGMASLGELANLMKGGAEEEQPAGRSKEEREAAKRERKERARREYEEAAARESAAAEQPPPAEQAPSEAAAPAGATDSESPEAAAETVTSEASGGGIAAATEADTRAAEIPAAEERNAEGASEAASAPDVKGKEADDPDAAAAEPAERTKEESEQKSA